jgi:hypothetical protein
VSAAFETARDLAAHDLPVFPTHTVLDGRCCSCGKGGCPNAGKHPRTPDGFKSATTIERTLLHWDAKWPDANWAVALGDKAAVVDIDPRHGGDPAEIIDAYGLTGPIVWTGEALEGDLAGTRGAHAYCSNGVPTGKAPVAGVEIKARGSYVMPPGSRHWSGVAYEWADDRRPWHGLQPVPEALVPARRAGAGKAPAPEPVPPGSMYDFLVDTAVRLVRAGTLDVAVIVTSTTSPPSRGPRPNSLGPRCADPRRCLARCPQGSCTS